MKTDEAKRLREDIDDILVKVWYQGNNKDITGKRKHTTSIINKVLDAVCMEVNNVGLGAHNTLATKVAINKLRP